MKKVAPPRKTKPPEKAELPKQAVLPKKVEHPKTEEPPKLAESAARVRILLVEDHPMMRRGIRDTIGVEPDLWICAEAEDVPSALRWLATSRPDIAIVDLSLGRRSGLEVIEQIRVRWPSVKVLVLSMHEDTIYAERAIRAGAQGYVNKSDSGETLVRSIRRILAGETVLSPEITNALVKRAVQTVTVPRAGMGSLSNRELQVFELFGRGFNTRRIAEMLSVSPKTVESHREHIKTKLEIPDGTELVRRAALWLDRPGRETS